MSTSGRSARAVWVNLRRGGRQPGRQHAHPAARQEPGAHAQADLGAEGPGGRPRGRARAALLEGRDPLRLPERHLSRPARRVRRVRRRRRRRGASSARTSSGSRSGRPPRSRGSSGPRTPTRRSSIPSGRASGATWSSARCAISRCSTTSSSRRSLKERMARPARLRAERPGALLRGLGARAGRAVAAGRRVLVERAPDLHDAQPGPAAGRRGRAGAGPRPPGGSVPRAPAERSGRATAGRDRGARRPHRRDPRDGRRPRLSGRASSTAWCRRGGSQARPSSRSSIWPR